MRSRSSQRDANVRWYAANRDRELERVTRRQAETTAFLRGLRDRPCADCGRRFHPVRMAFDHRDPAQKRFTLAKAMLKSRADLVAEVAKCDVVCSNCHSLRTRRQHRERLAHRDPSQAKSPRIDAQRHRWRYYADRLRAVRALTAAVDSPLRHGIRPPRSKHQGCPASLPRRTSAISSARTAIGSAPSSGARSSLPERE